MMLIWLHLYKNMMIAGVSLSNPSKPKRIRVVFNSSTKYQGISLNNILITDPNLINNLVGVLMRFRREPPVAITAKPTAYNGVLMVKVCMEQILNISLGERC